MANAAPSTPPAAPRNVILAAIDASAASQLVVERAARLAAGVKGSELHIAHVVDSIPVAAATVGGSPLGLPSAAQLLKLGREHLEKHMDLAQKLGADPTGHLLIGPPVRHVLQLATDLGVDLLVLGTHEPSRLERLILGSVADQITRKAPCAVMVVRPKREKHEDIPEIVPPCPDCLATQKQTAGKQLWCERHAAHHPHAHTYSELPEPFAVGSLTFRS